MRSIAAHGLRKATFVSPDRETAVYFARSRSLWNGERAVIVEGEGHTSKVTLDRSGRSECQLTHDCRAVVWKPLGR